MGSEKISIGIVCMIALVLSGCNDGQHPMSAHADTSNALPIITQQDVVATDGYGPSEMEKSNPSTNMDTREVSIAAARGAKSEGQPAPVVETEKASSAATAVELSHTGAKKIVEEKVPPLSATAPAKGNKKTTDAERSTTVRNPKVKSGSTSATSRTGNSASARVVSEKINVSPSSADKKVVNTYAASIDVSYRVSAETFYIHRANLRILDDSLINKNQSRYLLSVGPVPKTSGGAFPYSIELLPEGGAYKKENDSIEIFEPALANIQDTALAITLKDNEDAETTLRYSTPFVLIYDADKKLARNVSMYVAQDGYATIDGGSMVQLHAQEGCSIGYYEDRSFVRLGNVSNGRIHFDGNFQQATSAKYRNAQINCESAQSRALLITEDRQANVASNVHFSFYFENLYLHSS